MAESSPIISKAISRADSLPARRLGEGLGVPLLLALLALLDLRVELQLLADHVTLAAVAAAIRSHPLAVAVLLLQPSLLRHYRRRNA